MQYLQNKSLPNNPNPDQIVRPTRRTPLQTSPPFPRHRCSTPTPVPNLNPHLNPNPTLNQVVLNESFSITGTQSQPLGGEDPRVLEFNGSLFVTVSREAVLDGDSSAVAYFTPKPGFERNPDPNSTPNPELNPHQGNDMHPDKPRDSSKRSPYLPLHKDGVPKAGKHPSYVSHNGRLYLIDRMLPFTLYEVSVSGVTG